MWWCWQTVHLLLCCADICHQVLDLYAGRRPAAASKAADAHPQSGHAHPPSPDGKASRASRHSSASMSVSVAFAMICTRLVSCGWLQYDHSSVAVSMVLGFYSKWLSHTRHIRWHWCRISRPEISLSCKTLGPGPSIARCACYCHCFSWWQRQIILLGYMRWSSRAAVGSQVARVELLGNTI